MWLDWRNNSLHGKKDIEDALQMVMEGRSLKNYLADR